MVVSGIDSPHGTGVKQPMLLLPTAPYDSLNTSFTSSSLDATGRDAGTRPLCAKEITAEATSFWTASCDALTSARILQRVCAVLLSYTQVVT